MESLEGPNDPARISGTCSFSFSVRNGSRFRSAVVKTSCEGSTRSTKDSVTPRPSQGANVEVRNLSRSFSETGPVLETLNLKIGSGEFVALLGPSGCGKSTLLRLIAGLDQPNEGELRVDAFGRDSFRGFVFQESQLLPWRTVLENVALPLELQGIARTSRIEKAHASLEKVGLTDAIAKYPNQLSGGMKMRVSVARALVTEPSLLLLDEPFAALDETTRYQLQSDLRALWAALKMTVLFVTHSVSEAVYLADRAVVFSPRPARVLLDHRIALSQRDRLSVEFNREVQELSQAYGIRPEKNLAATFAVDRSSRRS
jgi:NitT/TauT family transport system ATP-binding protein